MKVLVVDDSRYFRTVLRKVLESGGYEVAEACDGIEAIAKLEQDSYDLVTLDVEMPKLDGFETCRRIRHGKTIPVLFLTADDTISGE